MKKSSKRRSSAKEAQMARQVLHDKKVKAEQKLISEKRKPEITVKLSKHETKKSTAVKAVQTDADKNGAEAKKKKAGEDKIKAEEKKSKADTKK